MFSGLYFHAKDVWEPDVGDVRVQFAYAGRDGEQVRSFLLLPRVKEKKRNEKQKWVKNENENKDVRREKERERK